MTDISTIRPAESHTRLGMQGFLVGLAIIAAGITILLLWFREGKRPHQAIELVRRVEILPAATMKAFSLRPPFSGMLTVSTTSNDGGGYSVYLVQQQGGDRSKLKNNEFRLITPFTAEHVSRSKKSSPVEAGEYNLTLISAADPGGAPNVSVTLYVRLDP